jgi:hypothetical protein
MTAGAKGPRHAGPRAAPRMARGSNALRARFVDAPDRREGIAGGCCQGASKDSKDVLSAALTSCGACPVVGKAGKAFSNSTWLARQGPASTAPISPAKRDATTNTSFSEPMLLGRCCCKCDNDLRLRDARSTVSVRQPCKPIYKAQAYSVVRTLGLYKYAAERERARRNSCPGSK